MDLTEFFKLIRVSILKIISLLKHDDISVNCQWSSWSEWSSCSYSCGTGTKQQSRLIRTKAKNGGEPCQGSDTQIDRCIYRPCIGG